MRSLLALCAAALVACAETSTAIIDTAKQIVRPGAAAVENAKLDPRYRYLLVTHAAGISGLVLGFVERDEHGPIEVWYAVDGEVLRLQNGRVVGVTGLHPEWRAVRLPQLPSWAALTASGNSVRWERLRDVMPGYRYGVRDELVLSPVPPPRSSRLRGMDARELTWFEERTARASEDGLPPARYAVKGGIVVYGEQCVSRDTCFSWQRWPAGA